MWKMIGIMFLIKEKKKHIHFEGEKVKKKTLVLLTE